MTIPCYAKASASSLPQILISAFFGEAGGGLDALTAVATDEPDIILLDLNMKGMTGLDTLNAMRQEGVTSRIVILTVSDAKQDVIRLLRAGADGYLLKDTEPDLLLEKLKKCHAWPQSYQ